MQMGTNTVIAMREQTGLGINAITCQPLVFIYITSTYQTIVRQFIILDVTMEMYFKK